MSKWKHLDAKGRKKQTDDDVRVFFGCVSVLFGALALAWVGFLGWLLYTVAEWLVSK